MKVYESKNFSDAQDTPYGVHPGNEVFSTTLAEIHNWELSPFLFDEISYNNQ